jgi:hypothetical protein
VDSDVEPAFCGVLKAKLWSSPSLHNESATFGAWEVPHLRLGRCPTSVADPVNFWVFLTRLLPLAACFLVTRQ